MMIMLKEELDLRMAGVSYSECQAQISFSDKEFGMLVAFKVGKHR